MGRSEAYTTQCNPTAFPYRRVSERKRRWLLESAAAANMNMVRVWGGGRTQARYDVRSADA